MKKSDFSDFLVVEHRGFEPPNEILKRCLLNLSFFP